MPSYIHAPPACWSGATPGPPPRRRQQTHALSDSYSLSVFPTAWGFDSGSRSAKRLNHAVRSEEALVGSSSEACKSSMFWSKAVKEGILSLPGAWGPALLGLQWELAPLADRLQTQQPTLCWTRSLPGRKHWRFHSTAAGSLCQHLQVLGSLPLGPGKHLPRVSCLKVHLSMHYV